jgi:hypothetical protein
VKKLSFPARTAAALIDSKKRIASKRSVVFLISFKRILINFNFWLVVYTAYISNLLIER